MSIQWLFGLFCSITLRAMDWIDSMASSRSISSLSSIVVRVYSILCDSAFTSLDISSAVGIFMTIALSGRTTLIYFRCRVGVFGSTAITHLKS